MRTELLAALLGTTIVCTAPAVAASPTTFTYQGHLAQDGIPAEGAHEFEVRLFDALDLQIGIAQTASEIVTAGVFSMELDFGNAAFDGNERYLEISVRSVAEGGAYTTLSPRTPVTSAPVAQFALSGNEGPQGPAGAQGIQGDPGTPGADGVDGAPGLPGNDGAQGPQGEPGVGGADGAQGLPGNDGAQGLPGTDGAQGLPGNDGAQGLPGNDGAQGLPGNDGAQGPQGDQGIPGAPGDSHWQLNGSITYYSAGNVGIGTADPERKLHVLGDIALIERAGNSPGVMLKNTGNGSIRTFYGLSSTGPSTGFSYITDQALQRVLYLSDGNAGIGTGTPLNKLSVNGNADFTGNVGIGNSDPQQALDVDGVIRSRSGGFEFPDGTVLTSAAHGVEYSNFGTGSFQVSDAVLTLVDNGLAGIYWTGGGGSIHAPINLPDGATILELTAHVWDNSFLTDINITIRRRPTDNATGVVSLGSVTSTTSSNESPSISLNHVVDNQAGQYFLRCSNVNGPWPNNQSLTIYFVQIKWQR